MRLGQEAGAQLFLQRWFIHMRVEGRPVAVADRHQEGVDVVRRFITRDGGASGEHGEGGGEKREAAHPSLYHALPKRSMSAR